LGLSVQDLISTLVDRRPSPSAENHVVTQIGQDLRKASNKTGGPGDLLSGSKLAYKLQS